MPAFRACSSTRSSERFRKPCPMVSQSLTSARIAATCSKPSRRGSAVILGVFTVRRHVDFCLRASRTSCDRMRTLSPFADLSAQHSVAMAGSGQLQHEPRTTAARSACRPITSFPRFLAGAEKNVERGCVWQVRDGRLSIAAGEQDKRELRPSAPFRPSVFAVGQRRSRGRVPICAKVASNGRGSGFRTGRLSPPSTAREGPHPSLRCRRTARLGR